MAYDTETKNQFIELRAKGWTFSKIAEHLGISKQTAVTWSKDLHAEIANLRNIELEALQEKYKNTVEQRLKLFGRQFKRVTEELRSRDLSEVPTKDLCEMFLKLAAALKKEQTVCNFRKKENMTEILLKPDTYIDQWPA
jgi:transposase